MLKLMKYEFRKTMFSKGLLLLITAVAEIVYLLGVFLKWDAGLGWGIAGLVLCAMIGIFYIGIESLLVFHRDLNTKQSYMLFLTPKNSYQILGAKVLENGISIFLTGVFFALLAAADWSVGVLYVGGVKEFLNILHQISVSIHMDMTITARWILVVFFTCLASWLMMIVTGDLSVVLSATVLAGKKFSGLVSFLIYMALTLVSGKILNLIPPMDNDLFQLSLIIAAALGISAVMYLAAGWIMEKKLSV